MYIIVAMKASTNGVLIECYGPFNTKREARAFAATIKWAAIKLIEPLHEGGTYE